MEAVTEHGADAVGSVCLTVVILALIACIATSVVYTPRRDCPPAAEKHP